MPSVTLDVIQAVLNMRDARRYVVNVLDELITLKLTHKLNEWVAIYWQGHAVCFAYLKKMGAQ